MIEFDGLSISYDKDTLLENISLTIDTHISILGANGSGKSSLAKAMCGLNTFEGKLLIDTQRLQTLDRTQRAKLISYTPTKLDLYDPYISVSEFVLLGRFPYKKTFLDYSIEDREIVQKNLDFLKIKHLKNHLVSSLSSGEQQLLLIAQALSQQSKIIIFDEPTANLDPHNSKIIAQHIKNLKSSHQIILITHDIQLASFISSSILFIKNKKIHSYEDDFFDDATLKSLYNVEFEDMVVQYD